MMRQGVCLELAAISAAAMPTWQITTLQHSAQNSCYGGAGIHTRDHQIVRHQPSTASPAHRSWRQAGSAGRTTSQPPVGGGELLGPAGVPSAPAASQAAAHTPPGPAGQEGELVFQHRRLMRLPKQRLIPVLSGHLQLQVLQRNKHLGGNSLLIVLLKRAPTTKIEVAYCTCIHPHVQQQPVGNLHHVSTLALVRHLSEEDGSGLHEHGCNTSHSSISLLCRIAIHAPMKARACLQGHGRGVGQAGMLQLCHTAVPVM